jgi:hypothetical protein
VLPVFYGIFKPAHKKNHPQKGMAFIKGIFYLLDGQHRISVSEEDAGSKKGVIVRKSLVV